MWQIDNQTPFAAERGWVRDRTGAEVWLVAVKCTFDIDRDGSTAISAEQPPVLRVRGTLRRAGQEQSEIRGRPRSDENHDRHHRRRPRIRAGQPAGHAAGRRVSRRLGAQGAACVRRSAVGGVWTFLRRAVHHHAACLRARVWRRRSEVEDSGTRLRFAQSRRHRLRRRARESERGCAAEHRVSQ